MGEKWDIVGSERHLFLDPFGYISNMKVDVVSIQTTAEALDNLPGMFRIFRGDIDSMNDCSSGGSPCIVMFGLINVTLFQWSMGVVVRRGLILCLRRRRRVGRLYSTTQMQSEGAMTCASLQDLESWLWIGAGIGGWGRGVQVEQGNDEIRIGGIDLRSSSVLRPA